MDRSLSTAPAPDPAGDGPPSAKLLMTTLVKAMEMRFDQALTKLTELGAPPVADGQRLFDESLREMREVKERVTELNAELAKLQDLDEAAFMAASEPLTTVLAESEGANPVTPLTENPELKAVLESSPTCKGVLDPSES
ncbi:hypothetical protein [Actinokineospora pegani]|uniref:hypothetical protein n=1 Tax=Actinokineospora pegani TaxID=2654637 RepID=UPI0012EADC82|nr:hypothetical protein [Actinokineospora pegani]